VGYTSSTNFPVYNPGGGAYYQGTIGSSDSFDVFILKFDSIGVRLWATYYGGGSNDIVHSVAMDPQGNVYVVGQTYFTGFPVYNPGGGAYYQGSNAGYSDVFILKFNSSGVRQWATYYGGSDYDYAYSVAIDPQGNVYVVGYTLSIGFPVYDPGGGAYYQGSNAGYYDAFILKFNSNGVRLWATYCGGNNYDYANSVATDPQGNVYVVGYTYSTDFPVYDPGGAYYQGNYVAGYDAFILKFEGIAPIDEPRGKDWVRFSFKNGTLILLLDSSADCEAILSIYDASGRPIYGPIARRLSSGETTKLEIKVPASGVYFYEVETPYLRDKGKIVIVR